MRSLSKVLIVFAAVMALAGSSFAQSPKRFRTSIPFDFAVDGQKLPAGIYTVTIVPDYKVVSFENTAKLLNARVSYRSTNVKSGNRQVQLQFSADNSFEGFRGVDDGGIAAGSGQKALANNVSKTNTGKGSAD
jgi:hypothetical protein